MISRPQPITVASVPRRSACLPHRSLILSGLARHSVTHSQPAAARPVSGSAATPPACQLPTHRPLPDPFHAPDRSSIAISASRFRYCRSWVICLMPSGPSWSRQSVYATWLETSSRAWAASCLNPIIIMALGACPGCATISLKHPFSHICHDTSVPRLVGLEVPPGGSTRRWPVSLVQ